MRVPRRRPLTVLLVGLVTTLALAGCGNDGASTSEASEETSASAAFPVTVTHKFGESVIEQEPKRIVTLGYNDQDAVLALGRTPVASVSWFEEKAVYPWAEAAAEKAGGEDIDIISAEELESGGPEAVAAHRPDLIIAIFSYLTKEDYAEYSKIAPTIVGLADYPNDGTPWQQQTELVGQALGKADEAKTVVAEAEQEIADIAAEHSDFTGKTAFASAGIADGQVCLYPTGRSGSTYQGGAYGPGYLLPALGFTIPEEFDELGEAEATPCLSYELMSKLDLDVGLWAFPRDDDSAKELATIPTYQSLDLVKQGREVYTSTETGIALNFSTVLSLPWAASQLAPQLVAALDADPSTSTDPA